MFSAKDAIPKSLNNTWQGFHKDIENLIITLKRNMFPSKIIDRVIKQYLNNTSLASTPFVKSNTGSSTESVAIATLNFKLPYLNISSFAQRKVRSILKAYCSNLDIRLVFSSYKLSNMFSSKDPIPKSLRSRVVYKISCAECNSVYVGETSRHFSTRVREQISRDKNSHIYKHITSPNCQNHLCSEDSFTILDSASSSYQLKTKEALHINWLKPNHNSELTHIRPLVVFLPFFSLALCNLQPIDLSLTYCSLSQQSFLKGRYRIKLHKSRDLAPRPPWLRATLQKELNMRNDTVGEGEQCPQ